MQPAGSAVKQRRRTTPAVLGEQEVVTSSPYFAVASCLDPRPRAFRDKVVIKQKPMKTIRFKMQRGRVLPSQLKRVSKTPRLRAFGMCCDVGTGALCPAPGF